MTLSEREKEFKEQVLRQPFPPDILDEFFEYWTEPDKKLLKMRFELEKTWHIGRRLKRWQRIRDSRPDFTNKEVARIAKPLDRPPENDMERLQVFFTVYTMKPTDIRFELFEQWFEFMKSESLLIDLKQEDKDLLKRVYGSDGKKLRCAWVQLSLNWYFDNRKDFTKKTKPFKKSNLKGLREKNMPNIELNTAELRKEEFQTPLPLSKFMVSLIPKGVITVLEPTPGMGNIERECSRKYDTTAPIDFFQMEKQRFDCVVMNPPFSIEYAYGLPDELNKKGSQVGYHILKSCMGMTDNIIAMLPWFILTNSEKRMKQIKAWGLKSVCIVPRRWFPGSRASNCILVLQKGYTGKIELTTFDDIKQLSLI